MTDRKLAAYLKTISFNALVGVRLVRVHRDGVTVECPLRPDLMNAHGVLHGGVTATLADVAVGMALARRLGRPRSATTVEMKLNYLKPVSRGYVRARARLLRVGKNLCCGSVEVFDSEKNLVAAALVTYMILGSEPRK